MDTDRFDRFTRAWSLRTSRRAALLGLVGLATVAGEQGVDAARVTCRRSGGSCLRNAHCCTGYCEAARNAPRSRRNRCGCPTGQAECDGRCVALDTKQNCGECGNVCPGETSVCLSGDCICPAENESLCSDGCADTDTSLVHCGDCEQPCGPDADFCLGGTCAAIPTCDDSPYAIQVWDACFLSMAGETYHITRGSKYPRPCATDADCQGLTGWPKYICPFGGNWFEPEGWAWYREAIGDQSYCYGYLERTSN